MPDDAYIDHSLWTHFFNDSVVFMDDMVLIAMLKDIADELHDRKTENENEDKRYN